MQHTTTKNTHTTQTVTIAHWNCHKLTTARNIDLRCFIYEHKPDIICLNELKLNEQECNDRLQYDGYISLFRCRDPIKSHGGGVAIIIRRGIAFSEVDMHTGNLELISIRINFSCGPLTIIAHYNPPSSLLSAHLLNGLLSSIGDFLLVGDLNAIQQAVLGKNQRDTQQQIGERQDVAASTQQHNSNDRQGQS